MSWIRLDDDMLDHEKWRSALREGGDAVLLVWLRLTSWCSRRLTDGRIPAKMVAEIACLERSKSRARALQALVESGLCTRHVDGSLTMSGYLDRNPSKADVLAERDRRAEAQRKRRLGQNVTGHATTSEPDRNDVPSRPVPSRPLSLSNESEDARAPESESRPDPATESEPCNQFESAQPPAVPGLTVVVPGPLQPSKREQAREAAAAQLSAPPGVPRRFDPDWEPRGEHRDRGRELGLTETQILEEAEDCRRKLYPHGFLTEDDQFFRELTWLSRDLEKTRFKNMPKAERDAFEMPGRERRA